MPILIDEFSENKCKKQNNKFRTFVTGCLHDLKKHNTAICFDDDQIKDLMMIR